ncbi:MAG: GlsB/YeaQ/YmgE family stress response membrane protein [Gemmataceae bacterium]|nr:GlsB/YeaQ/YmgE family stress response membrane protein [Gemmataceae bacterium]
MNSLRNGCTNSSNSSGFVTLVGLLAKAVLPGKDGGGALATVVLGIIGSVVGAALLSFFVADTEVKPISFLGFIVAMGGTTLLLVTYRILGGGGGVMGFFWPARFRNRRRATTVIKEE